MKIAVIGGGFAGIAASRELSKKLKGVPDAEIFLIDKKDYVTMLPNLPEVAGGRLMPEYLTEKITRLIPQEVKFIQKEVKSIDLDEKEITMEGSSLRFDYIILSAGSTTNFYNFNEHMEKVHVLDSVDSALEINSSFKEQLSQGKIDNVVVCGAGFTGLELACNLYDLAKSMGKSPKFSLIERAQRIIPMLSEKMAKHVSGKLDKLHFKIYTDNQIVNFDGDNMKLKDGTELNNVFFCWCSGVKNALTPKGKFSALPDGRIIVDENLKLPDYEYAFAAGDSAAMKDDKGGYLRRGVNFSQMSGKKAASNLIAAIRKESQSKFVPFDPGWVIPIYISSIGVAFGAEIRGRKGIFAHYMICGMKNFNMKNFFKDLSCAIKYTFVKP